jgi:hypothetical protein
MDALLEVFPDACIVQTHRDPAKAIPSVCSTMEAARTLGDGERTDPLVLGRREAHLWSEAMQRTMAVRDRSPGHVFDVHHRDFHKDPVAVVRAIYDRFGLTLSPLAESRMMERIQANPESSHGTHEYTLEHFGLSKEALHQTFHDYIERFNLLG